MKPSTELNKIFDGNGHFYEMNICGAQESCRSLLEIRRRDQASGSYDLLVIMMNPGSSKPTDESKVTSWAMGAEKKLVPTQPDTTQYQIMRLMDKVGLNFARIINLSDLRTPKSSIFYQKASTYRSDSKHSIFNEARSKELRNLFENNVPLVCAWGLSRALLPLVQLASPALSKLTLHGLKGSDKDLLFRHPLPQNWNQQKEWVEKVSGQLFVSRGSQ
jgi:hypothetical protein